MTSQTTLTASAVAVALVVTFTASAQTYPVRTLSGSTLTGGFATALAVCSDVDGDGHADIVTGSPEAGTGTGHVKVFSGSTGENLLCVSDLDRRFGFALAASTVDGLPTLVIGVPDDRLGGLQFGGGFRVMHVARARTVQGVLSGERLGSALAGIGDVDGDFVPDFIAGAPNAATTFIAGRARVISGRTGTVIRTHTGSPLTNLRFGASACGLGDVDGDDVPDYAIGDPKADAAGADSGQVKIFSGATGATLHTFNGGPGDEFGEVLVGVGNFAPNGQNLEPGLAVGAPHASGGPGAPASGYVRVIRATSGTTAYTLTAPALAGALFGSALTIPNTPATVLGNGLIVGRPGATVGGATGAGEIRYFNLTTGALSAIIQNPQPGQADQFGASLARGFHPTGVNDDYEIAVGAPNGGPNDVGVVYVFAGTGPLLTQIQGAQPGESFGRTVAFVGDVDGDDRPELAVGSPTFGGTAGRVSTWSGSNGTFVREWLGANGDSLGSSLAAAGNPIYDRPIAGGVLMGAPFAGVGLAANAGQVRTSFAYEMDVIRNPSVTGVTEHLGSACAFVGDVDADGADDFAVGAPEAIAGGPDAGSITIFSGRTHQPLRTSTSPSAGEHFGAAVDGVGDVDGDGVPDVATGCPGADNVPLATNVGRIRIVSGASGATIRSILGSTSGEALGSRVVGVGDVNGDGVPDVAGASPTFNLLAVGAGVGRVRAFSGATGTVLRSFNGASAGDAFGSSVARAGDVDGDGVTELLVGVPFAEVSAAANQNTGRVHLVSLTSGAVLDTITRSVSPNADFGTAIATGDLTGDCRPDFVVSAPGDVLTGRVFAVSRFGLPNGASVYGAGSPGAGGYVPGIATFGGTPNTQGAPQFGIALTCARGGAAAYFLGGGSSTAWAGGSLPQDLTAFGLSGCVLLTSADFGIPVIANGAGAGDGFAALPTPVPASPALAGLHAFGQWIVFDDGAPNGIAAVSPGLELVIQTIP